MAPDAMMTAATGMAFNSADAIFSMPYLLGPVLSLAAEYAAGDRILDVGCGNGYWSGLFARRGLEAVGIDVSESGIALARKTHEHARFELMDVSEDMLHRLNETPFGLVISTEVVEHLYSPQTWARGCYNALQPGGTLIVSTPYHGWLKNVALAVSGAMDRHLDALREGGHIKFFSRRVLESLLFDAGFRNLRFTGAGRAPYMWKSMVMSATRPID